MLTRRFRFATIGCLFPLSVLPHHSTAIFDDSIDLTLSGEVTGYEFVNPHVYVHLETVNENGEVEAWSVEMQAPGTLRPRGWSQDTFQPGDRVVAVGHPLRSRAGKLIEGVSISPSDGDALTTTARTARAGAGGPRGRDVGGGAVPAEEYNGLYQVAARNGIHGPPIAIYEQPTPEIRAEFPIPTQGTRFIPYLNERGKAAARIWNGAAAGNPWCSPYPYFFAHHTYSEVVEIERRTDQVIFRKSAPDGQEQIVYIGAEHPPANELFPYGHAIGEWNGEVLTIDITNFEPNPWGIARGLPSGRQKHVSHLFRWRDDRTALDVNTTLFDPEFMTAPYTIETSFFHKPDLQLPVPVECSEESGNRVFEALQGGE